MKLTEFRKGKLIGGIFAIVFSIWHFLHSYFFYRIYVNNRLSKILNSISAEEVEKFTNSYGNLNSIIYCLLLSILLITIILLFICHKKNGVKIIRKNEIKTKLPTATSCILGGIVLFIVLGEIGIFIADPMILIGGILLIIA